MKSTTGSLEYYFKDSRYLSTTEELVSVTEDTIVKKQICYTSVNYRWLSDENKDIIINITLSVFIYFSAINTILL